MNFFSVFSGIGGFDLGLEWAGWQCAGQCELEPFCNAVLEKHWPNAWRHTNVKTLTGKLISDHCGRIDALVGGPPCQPASVAGQRRGAADDRWLWPDFLRLVSEIKPVWVLAENPRGVLSIDVEGLQFSEWLASQFADRGYELLPVELAAEDVGAPHRRERIFFLAYTCCPERRAAAQGRINDDHRADAGRQEETGRSEFRGEAMADSNGGRQYEPQGGIEEERRRGENGGRQWPARPGEPQHEWEAPRVIAAESGVGGSTARLSRGLARRRVAALKALGNAVVPQCAEVIGRMINRYAPTP